MTPNLSNSQSWLPQRRPTKICHSLSVLILLTCLTTPSLSQALIISVSQTVDADWEYLPPNQFDLLDGSTSKSYSSPGSRTEQLNMNGATRSEVNWSTDIAFTNTIQSSTRVNVDSEYTGGDYLSSYEVNTTNTTNYFDQVTYNGGVGQGFLFRFASIVTGRMAHAADLGGNNSFVLDMQLENRVNLIAGGIGQAGTQSVSEVLPSSRSGFNPATVSEDRGDINLPLVYQDMVYQGQPLDFSYFYSETLKVLMEAIDAESSSAAAANRFTTTVKTYASVFDLNGNLLPDARVSSVDGFEYDPLPFLAQQDLPNPSTLFLISLGLIALLRLQRNLTLKTQILNRPCPI